MDDNNTPLKRNLAQAFGLSDEHLISKAKILEALTLRIGQMMQSQTDQLFSLLYRLDISERNIKAVLEQKNDVPLHLAKLIYKRQIEKAASRKHFSKENPPEDDLAW